MMEIEGREIKSLPQSTSIFCRQPAYALRAHSSPATLNRLTLAAMKAAVAILPHKEGCVSQEGHEVTPQASAMGFECSLHPAFILFVCTSVSFT
jgi:hypothetical protein